mmetsp:Transcript_28612/g.75667  ORF Transcript_28612/g.75667 Transcript_28612/m.75667 type:complete len:101 (-) Transcript_28612:454-756(-)
MVSKKLTQPCAYTQACCASRSRDALWELFVCVGLGTALSHAIVLHDANTPQLDSWLLVSVGESPGPVPRSNSRSRIRVGRRGWQEALRTAQRAYTSFLRR